MTTLLAGVAVGRALHGARGLKLGGPNNENAIGRSRPSRGAWIETMLLAGDGPCCSCRALHGARGLKQVVAQDKPHIFGSRPSRGAWIETPGRRRAPRTRRRRALHGARGLKRARPPRSPPPDRRALHGARGLKQGRGQRPAGRLPSRPSRGAWIETRPRPATGWPPTSSRPSRGAWIETSPLPSSGAAGMSRPSRGAWIETSTARRRRSTPRVAPFTGRVD